MKKLLVGLLALGSISALAANTCVSYDNAKKVKSICADIEENSNVVSVVNPRLIDLNDIDWPIGKGISPKKRAEKICEALGITTQLVLSYRIDHLGQNQANVNLKGNTSTSMFDAITEIDCLKD